MLQVDPIQSYLNLKIGLPPVLKAGSSGNSLMKPQQRIFSGILRNDVSQYLFY